MITDKDIHNNAICVNETWFEFTNYQVATFLDIRVNSYGDYIGTVEVPSYSWDDCDVIEVEAVVDLTEEMEFITDQKWLEFYKSLN